MKRLRPITWGLLLLALTSGRCVPTSPSAEPSATPTAACIQHGVVRQERVDSPTLGWAMQVEYYLPPCYDQQEGVSFPVLYLIPGMGGTASAWNALGGAAETADRLIRSEQTPPFILVTPANHSSDTHGEALINDLIPHIDANLRTLTDRRHRAVGGASLGGVMAYRMAFEFPDLFGCVGVISSGVNRGDRQAFDAWIAAIPPDQWPRVLIDYGDEDVLMAKEAKGMAEALDRWGVPYTFNVGSGGHNFGYWSSQIEAYLRWFTADW